MTTLLFSSAPRHTEGQLRKTGGVGGEHLQQQVQTRARSTHSYPCCYYHPMDPCGRSDPQARHPHLWLMLPVTLPGLMSVFANHTPTHSCTMAKATSQCHGLAVKAVPDAESPWPAPRLPTPSRSGRCGSGSQGPVGTGSGQGSSQGSCVTANFEAAQKTDLIPVPTLLPSHLPALRPPRGS